MDSNSDRLTLRLELGVLLSTAKAQDSIYQKFLKTDTPPDRFSSLHWEDVLDKSRRLGPFGPCREFHTRPQLVY